MRRTATAERALAAYGGEERWRAAAAVELELSAGGLAFRLKWQPALHRARQRLEVHRPWVRCQGIDAAGDVGILDGGDVRVETPEGRALAERRDARAAFGPGRRWLYWDSLDQTYFACYAAWNYFTLPGLLLREDVRWSEPAPGVLEAGFPASLPTHSAVQRFRFDMDSGLLLQHDYTAEVFGGWARASRVVQEHGSEGGVVFPRRMRVTPRKADGSPRGWPVLVDIEAHAFRLV